jgi:hypothetical protein
VEGCCIISVRSFVLCWHCVILHRLDHYYLLCNTMSVKCFSQFVETENIDAWLTVLACIEEVCRYLGCVSRYLSSAFLAFLNLSG